MRGRRLPVPSASWPRSHVESARSDVLEWVRRPKRGHMSDEFLPPYAVALDPDEAEIIAWSNAMSDEIAVILDKHGVQEHRRSEVLEKLAFLFTWSDGEPED